MDLFTELIGGEQNMPPKLDKPASNKSDTTEKDTKPQVSDILDSFGNVQVYDDFLIQQPAPGSAKAPHQQAKRTKPVAASQDPAPTGPQASAQVTDEGNWELDPRMGEPSEVDTAFVPWLAAARFPYKLINRDQFAERIDLNFFAGGKLYTRGWDFYYAWHEGKVIPFVRHDQFEGLLKDIHKAFAGFSWKFEQRNIDDGLLITFNDPNPDLRPRFLGHTNIKEHYNYLLLNAPDPPNMNSLAGPNDDRSLEAFMERMSLAADASKAKSKGAKKIKQAEAVVKRQEMTKQVLRAQRYLGLNPKHESSSRVDNADAIPCVDETKPAPHPCDLDVIFIAIDVEAYERSPGIITEVGIATLDTRDLKGIAPNQNGVDWQKLIRARHFRIIENKRYINHEFVQGCPERFEFGTSEWISLQNIPSVLTSCFHQPFSKPDTPAPAAGEEEEKRQIVLLGHDTNQDIQYLHTLGFSVLNRGNLLEVMDTAAMFRSFTRGTGPGSLGHIVSSFDFTPWNLHNAGNDAVYTVWAMLAICVKDASERGSEGEAKRRERERQEKEIKAVELAKERSKEESEGWDAKPGEDGGAPKMTDPWIGRTGKAKGGSKAGEGWGGYYTSGGAPLDV